MRTILYAFWGRRRFVELQLPFIRRILDEHPNVEFHGWNLARDALDAAYIRSLSGEFTIRDEFYQHHDGWNNVWREYAKPEYSDCLFVKIDDDDVFVETDRFGNFLRAVEENPDTIISAQVINNGASTLTLPEVYRQFERFGIPLLDVHMSNRYAELSHEYFFEYRPLGGNVELVPAESWVSINWIGFHYKVGRRIAEGVGSLSPRQIFDRTWEPGTVLGDEGAANLEKLAVLRGFKVAHVSYGPQGITDDQLDRWLPLYESAGRNYLEGR